MEENEAQEYATKTEIAARYRHSVRSVEGWMKEHGMPYIKIEKSVRFHIPSCDEWFRTFAKN